MKLLVTGGGTGGHINPALAIAGYVRQQDPEAEILYVGNKGGMEQRLVPAAGFAFRSIVISGFQRKISAENIVKNIKTVGRIVTSTAQAHKIIKEFAPDICIGTGGYVSGPVIREAMHMGIPCLIHEQNAFPGVTTKMLSKKAKVVMLAVADAQKYLDESCNCVLTGNPIRTEVLCAQRAAARQKLGVEGKRVILSTGGSLGAQKVNEAVLGLMEKTVASGKNYAHIHAYGQYGRWFPDALQEKGLALEEHPDLHVQEYINNMAECYAAADLVISRAGAISLSEIQATGKASILIPSPNVAENHQYHNAMALVNRDAAVLVEEKDLSAEILWEKTQEILESADRQKTLEANAKEMAILDTNARIYQIIQDVLKNR